MTTIWLAGLLASMPVVAGVLWQAQAHIESAAYRKHQGD